MDSSLELCCHERNLTITRSEVHLVAVSQPV
jgi:hypothetical protein